MALKPNQIRFVAGDTLPNLRGTLTEDDGLTPVDLTAGSVALHIGYDPPLIKAATITTPASGVWLVSWQPSDLREGTYNYEIQVTDAAGDVRTWNQHSASGKPLQMVISGEVA